MSEKVGQSSEPGEVMMAAARRILDVWCGHGECDYEALSIILITAAGMALARYHWPEVPPTLDGQCLGQCFGDGLRQGFEDKTRWEVGACRGTA